jgi:hypothetical protein
MPELPAAAGEEINVVLVGVLNPAIFHPEWFVRQALLSEAEAAKAEVQAITPQVSDLKFLDFGLQALQSRLTIKTVDVSKAPKINDLVIGILTKLPHTPITAAGINQGLHLATGSEENWHKIGNALGPKERIWEELYREPGLASITIESPRTGQFAGKTNVTVQPSVLVRYGVYVSSNVEYQPPQEGETALLVSEFIKSEWKVAIQEATRVAEQIFRELLWEQV